MRIICTADKQSCGSAAARAGLAKIRKALAERDEANIILATGLSQFEMLHTLAQAKDVNWNRVNAFHLDEYIGLPQSHPASFRLVLRQEFVSRLPMPLNSFVWIDGQADLAAECARLTAAICMHPIDVAFIGIGENGHLAFNDPPADFVTEKPYIVVELDDACRRQQLGEGWFKTVEEVPARAISMSIRQIMKSQCLIATVPDERKARAVKHSVEQPINAAHPGSILRSHPDATLFIEPGSAAHLGMAAGTEREMPLEPMP